MGRPGSPGCCTRQIGSGLGSGQHVARPNVTRQVPIPVRKPTYPAAPVRQNVVPPLRRGR